MNLDRLHQILGETTVALRKGELVTETATAGPVSVITLDLMPSVAEARPDLEQVDLHFIVVGVDKAKAETHRAELLALLADYPNADRLHLGPSYIEVGGVIGDQGAALRLFALGKVLGLWGVVTPATLGFSGPEGDQLAGAGFVMTTGLRSQSVPA